MDSSQSSAPPAPEASPKKAYRLMAGMALTFMALLGLAIYSLSQMKNGPSVQLRTILKAPTITSTLRQKLPQFEYSNEGKSLQAQNFEGKWTLLTFWAHWCAPCLEEMPALNQLGQQWQGPEFEVLTINVDDDHSENLEAAKRFMSDQNLALPTLFDKNGELKRAFAVHDLPQHFLIDPQMKIVWKATGAFKWENEARDQLLKVMEDDATAEDQDSTSDSDSEPSE